MLIIAYIVSAVINKTRNESDRQVFLTLAYSSCFNFALSKDEILSRLPSSKKLFLSPRKIGSSLRKLVDLNLIKHKNDYYFIEEKDYKNRLQRKKYILENKREQENFVEFIQKIPLIKAVVLTGSRAVENAKANDDLDFMVICNKNTVWMCRLLLIVLTKIKGKRPSKFTSNAWCFNLWLDEGDLTLREERRSLYEAYEILQMKFIYDVGGMRKTFLNANPWIRDYLTYYENYKFGTYQRNVSFSLLNLLLFWLQKSYRLIVFGKENFTLSPTQAFFNEISFKDKIFTKLEKKMKRF